LTATNATLAWDMASNVIGWQIKGHEAGTSGYGQAKSTSPNKNVGGLSPGTTYEWFVRAKCTDGNISAFSDTVSFTTLTLRQELASVEVFDIAVTPNPNPGNFLLQVSESPAASARLQVTDAFGRVLLERQIENLDQQRALPIDLDGVAPGIYFIRLESAEGTGTRRFVVSE
jgi:hypothetical protein